MYDVSAVLQDTEFAPGTNVLLTGPPLTGKRRVALEMLGEGAKKGEGSIIVTTKDSSERILESYGEFVDVDSVPIGIVDCVTKQTGMGNAQDDERVRYASSPVDMTGIGIKLSEFLQLFYRDRGVKENRILLYSLSTLLMYSDLQTVFRFMHVFTGRIQSVNALGVFVLDPTAHDDKTINTLKQLFDAIISVTEGTDGPALSLKQR